MAGLTGKKVDYASPMSRDTFHLCYYATSMKANLLDDGIGDTLVSLAFDDVTLISHGKRVNLRTRIRMADKSLSSKSALPRKLNRSQPNDFLSR
jgi:hypothetical protein